MLFIVSSGQYSLFIQHRAGAIGNKLNHIQSTIEKREKINLQHISKIWKLHKNLIVNDFDKPYVVVVFAS